MSALAAHRPLTTQIQPPFPDQAALTDLARANPQPCSGHFPLQKCTSSDAFTRPPITGRLHVSPGALRQNIGGNLSNYRFALDGLHHMPQIISPDYREGNISQ